MEPNPADRIMSRRSHAVLGLSVLLIGGIGLLPQAGRAHGIESSLERFGGLRASVESHFSSGLPAQDAMVRLVPPDGGPAIELGRTDANGRLGFPLPAAANDHWQVQVDAGSGHRDWLELGEQSLPPGRQVRHQSSGSWHAGLGWSSIAGLGLVSGLAVLSQRRRRF